jgi:hypothetical protein
VWTSSRPWSATPAPASRSGSSCDAAGAAEPAPLAVAACCCRLLFGCAAARGTGAATVQGPRPDRPRGSGAVHSARCTAPARVSSASAGTRTDHVPYGSVGDPCPVTVSRRRRRVGDAASASDRNRRRSLASNPKGRSCANHRSSRFERLPGLGAQLTELVGDRRDDHQPGSDERREEPDHEHRSRECGPRRDGAPAGVVPGATVPGSDRGVSSPGTTVCRNCRRPGPPGRATRVGSCGTRVGDGAHTAVARSRRATWVGQRPAPGWPCATAGAVGAVTG